MGIKLQSIWVLNYLVVKPYEGSGGSGNVASVSDQASSHFSFYFLACNTDSSVCKLPDSKQLKSGVKSE